MIDDYITENV